MTTCSSSISLLLLALSALSTFAVDLVNVNIDCGSSSTYTDGTGRTWVGDRYAHAGNSMMVSNILFDPVMNTLRVFSTGKTSCYSIPSLSQQKVLVRASFYYGNYDMKSSPPTFDLLLEDRHWATVETNSYETVWSEAIYVVKGSTVDVCVVRTSDSHIPFMSALEIRSMSTDMYTHFDTDTTLMTRSGYFYNYPISHISMLDSSGRIWASRDVPSGFNLLKSDAPSITGSAVQNNPPERVLRHAITVRNISDHLPILRNSIPTTNAVVPIHVNMYFSEVNPSQQRSFHVYVDGRMVTKEPVRPPYGSVFECAIFNVNSNSSIYLFATAESTLPPLLNAFEVFIVRKTVSDHGTTKKSTLSVIMGTTIPTVVIFLAIMGFLAIRRQKKESTAIDANSNMGQDGGPHGKDFVVQMTADYTGEAVLLANDQLSTTIHDSIGYDSDFSP